MDFQLPEEVINMLKVKAAVYTEGNLSAFIRKAVEVYQESLPSGLCICGAEKEQVLVEAVTLPEATFTHVPVHQCKICGHAGVDFTIAKIIEEYADRAESLDFATIIHP